MINPMSEIKIDTTRLSTMKVSPLIPADKITLKKPIHLLYVPTIYCNMSCKYCYLGDLTEQKINTEQAVNTLKYTLDQLLNAGYLPFNLSFHGGEVTALPSKVLNTLFTLASEYYAEYGHLIKAQGFSLNPVHIKTNMLNFNKHYDLFLKYKVSISGSIDLPLSLHDKYRVDKKDRSTLKRITENLGLLAGYPNHKKISCVVTQEHLHYIDEFIADIRYIHDEIGLDMNRFNIMFSFDSNKNDEKFGERTSDLKMLTQEEQVYFYQRITEAFSGSDLHHGLKKEWFKEFTPDFCCSAVNCGDKFFLLQYDGDVYSCPRGQSSRQFFYGNVFKDEVEAIIDNGWKVIERNENNLTIHQDCLNCEYIAYCHSGCTFARHESGLEKSYTCLLQKELYKDDPERYQPMTDEQLKTYTKQLVFHNNLNQLEEKHPQKQAYVTDELYEVNNQLATIVEKDKVLKVLYTEELFYLQVDDVRYNLKSPILKNENDMEIFTSDSEILLGIREDAFSIACEYEVNNAVQIMLLRDTQVIYGDENRSKQEHIFDYALYKHSLVQGAKREQGYYVFDIAKLLKQHVDFYKKGIRNNLFFTTKSLREYHYKKQIKSAFYHIQAINLPFPNIEFYWK